MTNNLVLSNSLPSVQEFQTMKDLGTMAVKSGFLPTSINTPEKAVIIMLKGRELGIPPMQAFSSIAVVNGKPTMSAELMLSMIYKNVPGAQVNFLKTDAKVCEIEAKRPNGKPTKFKFDMDDAKTANLTGKGPWVTYPSAMLRARCVSAMARAMFPDALSGVVYTPEELGADVDDDGNVLDVLPADPIPEVVEPPKNPLKELRQEKQAVKADLGEYECLHGKYTGQKLKDIDQFALDGYLKFLQGPTKKQGKALGKYQELVETADAYLCTLEFGKDPEFDSKEELPA